MRRNLSRIVVHLLAIAIAVPATLGYAAGKDGAPTASAAPAAALSLRDSTSRAIAAILATEPSAAQGPGIPARPPSTGIRAQGQGKSGMIMGLVSAAVGIVGAVYMLKYLKEQQKKTDGQ